MAQAAAIIGGGLSIGGTIMDISSKLSEGKAAKQAADFNAETQRQSANMALIQGEEEVRQIRILSKKQIGDAVASYGASGVDLEGSALDVLRESATAGERDAINARSNAQNRASMFRRGATQSEIEGRFAQKNAEMAAIGAGLSGAGRAVGMFGGK